MTRSIAQMERALESCLDLAKASLSDRVEVVELRGFTAAVLGDCYAGAVHLEAPLSEVFSEADPVALERIFAPC